MKKVLFCSLACGMGFVIGWSAPLNAADTPNSSASPSTAYSTLPAMVPVADSTAADARWLTSLPDAQALARKENKLVLVDFTGSDWCFWCKKLEAETFSKSEFADYARKHLVLVQLDFPHKAQPEGLKEANAALMRKYSVDGFPTLLAMKPNGAVVWKQEGYLEGGPSALFAKLDEARSK